jgi:tetratricopeptide (TPR) repeat protein
MTMKAVPFSLLVVSLLFPLSGRAQFSTNSEQQIQAHSRKAQEALSQNRPDLAIPEFRAILSIAPNNVDARGNLGVLLFFQGAYSEAIPQLRAVLTLQPGIWKIQALLGMAEKRTGDAEAARNNLEKAFPNLKEKKIRIDTGLELIELYSRNGELDKAAATVSTLRTLDPTNVAIVYSAYRLYSDLADEARLSLIVVAPKSAQVHQMMAHELARQGQTKEAIENYKIALQLDPKLPGLHFELAELMNTSSAAGGPEEAEKEYKAALEVNPSDEKSECRLGDNAAQRGALEEAQQHYERALQLQPDDTDANVGLAKVMMSLGQLDKAEALLKHATAVDPTIALAHFRLNTIYRQTGKAEDAKRELAEYQRYKDMKEKLKTMYRTMRLEPSKPEPDDAEANN